MKFLKKRIFLMRQFCLDCDKQPTFNFPNQKKAIYCADHKKPQMRDIIHPSCLDCNKLPSFNLPNQTKAIYCADHRKPQMRDVVHPTCLDCDKRPHFNFKGQTKGIYCAGHKQQGMQSINIPKCLECDKKPHFNFPDQKKGIYCADHRKTQMRNVVSRTCLECDKQPHFNLPGETRGIYCAEHQLSGMKNIVKPTCLECDKKPHFNFPGETRGIYCAEHRKPQMRNVVSLTCKTHLCDILVTKKYKGYCFRCFLFMFPDEPVTRNYKTKETAVSDFLKTSFPDITIIFDKKIDYGCSKRRPDCYIDMGSYTIVVEIDENQHGYYDCSCTNKRTMELFQDSGNRPLYLIRFNPDDYLDKDNKNITSCWGTTKKGICVVKKSKQKEWDYRLDYLKDILTSCINKKPLKEVDVIHLFYDLCLET